MNAVRRDTASSQSNVCPTNVSVVGDVAKKIKPEVMDTKGYVDISLDTQLEGEKSRCDQIDGGRFLKSDSATADLAPQLLNARSRKTGSKNNVHLPW